MTPDPSSLVKGLARQTNQTGGSTINTVVGGGVTLACGSVPKLGGSGGMLPQEKLTASETFWWLLRPCTHNFSWGIPVCAPPYNVGARAHGASGTQTVVVILYPFWLIFGKNIFCCKFLDPRKFTKIAQAGSSFIIVWIPLPHMH